MVVREMLGIGHEELKEEHLAYLVQMANRVGFTIIAAEPAVGDDGFQIRLNISMTNPVFVARLKET